MSCTLNLISTFLSLSLCWYLCKITFSSWWYHPPRSQYFSISTFLSPSLCWYLCKITFSSWWYHPSRSQYFSISTFLSPSLCWYLCKITFSSWWYHHPRSQYVSIGMGYVNALHICKWWFSYEKIRCLPVHLSTEIW
jgi:hypothetical protein